MLELSTVSPHESFDVAVFGDYNLPGIQWNSSDSLAFNLCENVTGRSIDNAPMLRNEFVQHDIYQKHPTLVNGKSYTLDLLFTNTEVLSSNVPYKVLSKINSHHAQCLNLHVHLVLNLIRTLNTK